MNAEEIAKYDPIDAESMSLIKQVVERLTDDGEEELVTILKFLLADWHRTKALREAASRFAILHQANKEMFNLDESPLLIELQLALEAFEPKEEADVT